MKGLKITLFAIFNIFLLNSATAFVENENYAKAPGNEPEWMEENVELELFADHHKFILINAFGDIIRSEETEDLKALEDHPAMRPLLKHAFFITQIDGDAYYMLM
ncbi:hypothetical protein [Persicobacter diffluens]|uniref:Uncharacterized protein n=1 Tax=Persicobacter diffluens TaxID=981 RepID=A0AAN4VY73_9BACT|nr:hypothetical protein PEDI_27780 [Persicobacter diffluens]